MSLPVVFGAMGLLLDLNWAYFQKQRVQTAADAAASAAAVFALNNNDTCATVTCGTALSCAGVTAPPTTSLQAGCLYALQDGPPVLSASLIENDSSHLPAGLTGVAPSMWVKATVSTSQRYSFMSVFGARTVNITASAISGVSAVPATSCVYALNPSATDAMQVKGAASISLTDCAVYIDSSDGTALDKTGSGDINATVNIVGNYKQVGSGNITPAPNTGRPSVSDPLSGLPAPTFSGCDQTNYSTSGSPTLNHGVYCGGISITGSGTVTLNPGIYIMNGGGFSVAGSANVTGSHVVIYNTATAGHSIGAVSFNGSGEYTLSAPNSGTYEGIVMFQDRAQSIGAKVSGSSSSVITGSLYFPDANLTYTGSSSAQFVALVADTITMVGTTAIKNDTNGTFTGISIAKAVPLQ